MKSFNAIFRQKRSVLNAIALCRQASSSDAVSTARWQDLDELKERTKGSLIPDTLKQIDEDEELQQIEADLKKFGQAKLTREERKKRKRALDNLGVPNFMKHINEEKKKAGIEIKEPFLRRREVEIFQVNISRYCNQACTHCHVESSPKRTEIMNRETVTRCLEVLRNSPRVRTLDITGGAPELCEHFRHLATEGKKLGIDVIDRCNLTVLLEPGQEDTAKFLADNKIHIVASLPCYTEENVSQQRGRGIFDKSIHALLILNALGYGKPETGLRLDLVYNPNGAFLPGPQAELEAAYKDELGKQFGIVFNDLFALTNFPVKRFADYLHKRHEMENYLKMLVDSFNLTTVENMMCMDTLSISWDGQLYDCDVNQQLDMAIQKRVELADVHLPEVKPRTRPLTIWDIATTADVFGHKISTDNHCFGCSAGAGSGCQGSIL